MRNGQEADAASEAIRGAVLTSILATNASDRRAAKATIKEEATSMRESLQGLQDFGGLANIDTVVSQGDSFIGSSNSIANLAGGEPRRDHVGAHVLQRLVRDLPTAASTR